jgi:hypothetical protein
VKRNASQRNSEGGANISAQVHSHAPTFAKVLDGRKQPMRGLWQRGARFYAQLSVGDFSTGEKRVRLRAQPKAASEYEGKRTMLWLTPFLNPKRVFFDFGPAPDVPKGEAK